MRRERGRGGPKPSLTTAKAGRGGVARPGRAVRRLQPQVVGAGVEYGMIRAAGDRPHEVIFSSARALGCDLIVMASHRRGTVGALLFGSQTQQVLAHCDLPVLVTR